MMISNFAFVYLLFASTTFAAGAPLRRSRSLLHVDDAPQVAVPLEESSVFDSEYGRMLLTDYSLSMSMTNVPIAFPTPNPTQVVSSDVPSLLPRSAAPSGRVVASDFPSLSPSDSPTEGAVTPSPTTPSHTLLPSSSPTEAAVTPSPTAPSHTLVPSSSPTESAASDSPSLTPTATSPAPSSLPTAPAGSDAPSSTPTAPSDALAPSALPSAFPTALTGSDTPSSTPTTPSDALAPSSSPSSSPTAFTGSDTPSLAPTTPSDALAPSSSPSSFPTAPTGSDAPSLTPTGAAPTDVPVPTSSPTEIPASDALAPSFVPSASPTEIPASDALAPSFVPSSSPSAPLFRQRTRSLLQVRHALSAEALDEKSSVFESEYGRMLHNDFSMSMPTSEPTQVVSSDVPSLLPRSAAPSGRVVASDFPSLSPSDSPTEATATSSPTKTVVSHTSSPTKAAVSHTLVPSSSPSEIPASDALAPSFIPSASPTEIPASDALAPSFVPSSSPSAPLLRQRARSLLQVRDAFSAEALDEESSVFDFEYGRMLHNDFSMSMPTSEPTQVVSSDVPSLLPRSAAPSGRVVASDFPSLSPSDSPTEATATSSPTKTVVSHTSSPTKAAVSHTLVPSSSPSEIPASDVLAPSSSPSEIPASDALAPSSSPTQHTVIPNQEWRQLGKPIVPLLEGLLGADIAMSADGSIIAIGTPGDSPGYIGVYSYNETTLTWDMMGGEIFDVIAEGSIRFGSSVAISADGKTVAGGSGYSRSAPDANGLSDPLAGRAQVNVYETGRWIQKGQSLVGSQCRSLGWSTALSGDGNRWVVSTPDVSASGDARCSNIDFGDSRGIVQVFDFVNGNEWAQVGNFILGSQPGSQLGQSVAISRDGLRIAAFSQGIPDIDPYYQVFEQDASGGWVQMGGNILVESAVATSSTNTLALSADGSRIVITSKRRDSGLGYFRVLEWTPETGSWTPMGEDVEDGDGCCYFFDYDTSVAISDYGTKVVYGNTGYRDAIALEEPTSFFRGNVRVFEYIDGSWQQVGGSMLGDDLLGEIWFGYSTAMSADGRRIAASAPIAFPNYVAAYELPWV